MKTRTISNSMDRIDVKVEGILNDLKTGIVNQAEAQKMLVSLCMDVSINKMRTMSLQVKALRDKQKLYFQTRNSKILDQCRVLEKDLDGKIETFLEIEKSRVKPELPLNV